MSDAYEWQFPPVEDAATSTNVNGSGSIVVGGIYMPMQSAGTNGTATCTWQFTKGGSAVNLYGEQIAQALRDAGIPVSSSDLNDLIKAITNGGQAATAIAQVIGQSIAEIRAQQPNQGSAVSTRTKILLSQKQVGDLIATLSTGNNSTLEISQILGRKRNQLKHHKK